MKISKIAPLAALALLAACSGSDAPPSADTNDTEMLDVTNEATNVADYPTPTPTPTDLPANVVDEAPAIDETQVQDDADATGMTARVNRDDSANEAAPADVSEKKE